MNVRKLIERLEHYATEYGDETEVRLAHQPSWPFEYSIGAVVAVDLADELPFECEQPAEPAPSELIIYIGEGRQLGYLPAQAAGELSWIGRGR